jgi:hypothetical protein
MTIYQWGMRKELTDGDGQFTGKNFAQVIICLYCFDWCQWTPTDCRLWMIDHSEKKHPRDLSYREQISVRGTDYDYTEQ